MAQDTVASPLPSLYNSLQRSHIPLIASLTPSPASCYPLRRIYIRFPTIVCNSFPFVQNLTWPSQDIEESLYRIVRVRTLSHEALRNSLRSDCLTCARQRRW